jgi:hypothetical protein
MWQTGFFERVGERVMPDVVEQGRQAYGPSLFRSAMPELGDDATREMIGAQRVLEARVRGTGIDEKRVAELANVAEPLERGSIEDGKRLRLEADVVPERVANDLELAGAGAQDSGTISLNCSKFFSNRVNSRFA